MKKLHEKIISLLLTALMLMPQSIVFADDGEAVLAEHENDTVEAEHIEESADEDEPFEAELDELRTVTAVGECGDDLTWVLYSDGELVIIGTGEMNTADFQSWHYYEYYSQIKTVTIQYGATNICDDAFHSCSALISISIPSSVTSIGRGAFEVCSSLTSVEIPDSVTTIGDWAFSGCTSLTNVTIGDSVDTIGEGAFCNCESLTSVDIPDSVTSIGRFAFAWCNSLTEVEIPKSVTSIDTEPFYECSNLTKITVDSANPNYSNDEYDVLYDKNKTYLIQYPIGNSRTEYIIPNGVTAIGLCAFEGCTALESVEIPGSVEFIPDGVFRDCTNLKKATIYSYDAEYCYEIFNNTHADFEIHGYTGSTAQEYAETFGHTFVPLAGRVAVASGVCGDNLTWTVYSDGELVISGTGDMYDTSAGALPQWWEYYEILKYATIESGVTSIGDYAFYQCSELISVSIPDTVMSIGTVVFATASKNGCNKFAKITVDENNLYYSNDEFGVLFNKNKTTLIQYPAGNDRTAYIIPNTVKIIGNSAFSCCANLASVTISDSVTTIGEHAFSACDGLTNIAIPNSVTHIGDTAFYSCENLTGVTIPASVTSIGSYAFYSCFSFEKAIIYSRNVTFGSNVFLPNSNVLFTLHGYAGSTAETYASENGHTFVALEESMFNDVSVDSIYYDAICDVAQKGIVVGTAEKTFSPDSQVKKIHLALYLARACTGLVDSDLWQDGLTPFEDVTAYKGAVYYVYANGIMNGTTATTFSPNDSITYAYALKCAVCALGYEVEWEGDWKWPYYAKAVELGLTGGIDIDSLDAVLNKAEVAQILYNMIYTYPADSDRTFADTYFSDKDGDDDGEITVPVSGVTLNRTSATINVGNTAVLVKATVLPSDATNKSITWGSSDPSVVTVTNAALVEGGALVTGVKIGTATITATTVNGGKTASCIVNVGASGTCGDNLTWTLDADGHLIIRGTGAMTDWSYPSKAPWYSYRGQIKTVTIESGVTNIGEYAFYECDNLISVYIPASITTIGDCAFEYCSSLTGVDISSGVTTIGQYAFYGCASLTSVYIPANVTSIEGRAFKYCTNLTGITVNSANANYSSDTYGVLFNKNKTTLIQYPMGNTRTTYTVPDSVTFIDYEAFVSCEKLTSVTIPESVAIIDSYAFDSCSSLTKVTIYSRTATFEHNAFVRTHTDLEIHGYAGSTAQTYANAYGHTFVPFIANGTCGDNLTWTLYADGHLIISGTGAMPNWNGGSSVPWYSYRGQIKTVTIGNGVTSIGNYAFYNCDSLTSVTIPASVTSIGIQAFFACYSLTSITVASSNANYSSDTYGVLFNKDKTTLIQYPIGSTRTTYSIPASVTTIGSYAFYDCDNLTSVTIPAGVTSIGGHAFSFCDSLTSVYIPASVTSIGVYAFDCCDSLTGITVASANANYSSDTYGVLFNKNKTTLIQYPIGNTRTTYSIPASVTRIGDGAFDWCTSLTSVDIPDGVTSIGYYAFRYCTSLTSVTIPANVTSIGESVFDNCTSLTSITIPESVTSIGYEAFDSCKSLTSITIPASVTSIGDWAFYACDSLTKATIYSRNATFGSNVFTHTPTAFEIYGYAGSTAQTYANANGHTFVPFIASGTCGDNLSWVLDADGSLFISGTGAMTDWSSYSSVSWYNYRTQILTIAIESGVTSIGDWAFSDCESLTSVDIPDSVTTIGDYAFGYCQNLTSVNLPNSLTGIGSAAFYDCGKLTSINIPEGVTSIPNVAFAWCTNLTNVVIPKNVTYIDVAAFYVCTSLRKATILSRNATFNEDVFEATHADFEIHGYAGSTAQTYAKSNGHTFVFLDNIVGEIKKGTAVVDGVLDNKYIDSFVIKNIGKNTEKNAISSDWDASCYADVYAMYDENYLYLFAHVTDDDLLTRGRSYATSTNNPIYNDLFEFRLNFNGDDAEQFKVAVDAYGYNYFGLSKHYDLIDYSKFICMVQTNEEAGIYDIELAIPCTKGGLDLIECGVLGLSYQINDINYDVVTTMFSPHECDIEGNSWTDSKYILSEEDAAVYVAQVGENKYLTIGEALAADGDITLLANITEEVTVRKEVSIIKNGFIANVVAVDGYELIETDGAYNIYTEVEKFVLSGATMTLGSSLSLDFAINTAKLIGTDNYAKMTIVYADGRPSETVTVPQSEWTQYSGAIYTAKFTGMAAKQMSDLITVKFYNSKGQQLTEIWSDSIETYAVRMLNGSAASNKKLRTVYVDMLNYGAAAQLQFNYDAINLANRNLTDAHKAWATTSVATTDNRVKGTGYAGSTLTLGGEIQLDLVFNNSAVGKDYSSLYAIATYTDHYGNAKSVRIEGADFIKYSSTLCQVSITGMAVADFRSVVSCTVYNADDVALASASDSVESYANRNAASLGAMVDAIVKFGASSYNYFH